MSFGGSLRFSTQKEASGKPVIFWQQQAMENNRRKPTKTNKYVKEQKFPLRGKSETTAGAAAQKAPPPNRRPANNRNPRSKGPAEITPGVVTLTQTQLDAILSTVGTLVNQNEELQKSQTRQAFHTDRGDANVLTIDTDRAESTENLLNLVDSDRRRSKQASRENQRFSDLNGTQNGPKVVEPDEIPGLGRVDDDVRVVAPSDIPGLGPVDPPPATAAPASIPKAHMTKAELKRLQWEKERADAERALSLDTMASPLTGVGAKRPPPNRLGELVKPATPRAHLTKAERRRRASETEEACNQPLSPGRTLTEFWSNAPRPTPGPPRPTPGPPQPTPGPGADEQPAPRATAVPRAHLTKAEIKRQQWEQERAENETRDAALNRPSYQAGARDGSRDRTRDASREQPSFNTAPVHQGAAQSKAESKRLQWERERAENETRDAALNRPSYQAGARDGSRDRTRDASHEQPSFNTTPGHQGAAQSKAESKRLQWERERAEIAARESEMNRQTYGARAPNQIGQSPVTSHPPAGPVGEVARGPMSKAELKRLQWEKERAEEVGRQEWRSSPQRINVLQQPNSSPFVAQPLMSKAEIKRLQWQKEREDLQQAEQQQEYSPWGRPGAGAPIRDTNGQVLSDYNQRKEDGDVRQSTQAVIDQQRQTQARGGFAAQVESTKPAAIRSSFALGGAAPDQDRFMSVKEREKKAWLEDLERQREEQRLAKEKQKEQRRQEEKHDTWADRFVPLPNAAPTHQAEELRVSSAPQVAPTSIPGLDFDPAPPPPAQGPGLGESMSGSQLTHLRGQNLPLDSQTRKEVEEKRRRQLEHQEAVKAQVEDHKRKKAEERERRAQEEMIEEQRLQAERDALNAMYAQERQKARDKEDQQRRRVESLKEAMDAATEQAHREKHERRMKKLQQGGHDTKNINANFEDGSVGGAAHSVVLAAHTEQVEPTPAKMTPRGLPSGFTEVAPSSVPGLELTPREVAVMSSVNHDPYQQDKVIVPSKYKSAPSMPFSDPLSPRREFGVQTDPDLNIPQNLSRESSVDIEFKGPFKNPKNTKKVRIQSAEQKQEVKKGQPKINERPRWGGGGGAATKKKVKQSEKDPYFEKRKQQREAQKLQRQQELLEMRERSMANARNKTNAAVKSRSKSRERDQGQGRGQGGARSRSLAGSRRGSSPPVPVLRTRSNQPSPPLPTHQPRRLPSPEPGPAQSNRRSRLDSHRSQGQRRTPREAQENQPPEVTNGHRGTSPPIPTLRKQSDHTDPLHSYRSNSPPLPATKQRIENDYNLEAHAFEPTKPSNLKQDTARHRYLDSDPLAPPQPDGDFVPFIRTAAILDPQMAEEPLPLSREATAVEKARKAYVHGIQPASYGTKMPNYEDRHTGDAIPEMPQIPETEWKKDPILNPSLVTGHPTGRQDRILQQLSDLRRGLMQKQRELEVASPMMD